MGLFSKIMGKKEGAEGLSKGFAELTVKTVESLTEDTVAVTLDQLPEGDFQFVPGQYLTLEITIAGEKLRRSYSICSGPNELIQFATKAIEEGKVSNWIKNNLKAGDKISVMHPTGHFKLTGEQTIVAFAGGSGITPMISMARAIEGTDKQMRLFYNSKKFNGIIFKEVLDGLKSTNTRHYLTQEVHEDCSSGRLNKETVTAIIKEDLGILRADGFFLCGPQSMVEEIEATLSQFGVNSEKIHKELFYVAPVEPTIEKTSKSTSGKSQVNVILDDEQFSFEMPTSGISILEKADKEGVDVPYSCKGGVCSTCRAKVLEGSASMDVNYSLTDKEIEQGYILTCQAHPQSEKLVISFDE